MKVQKISSINLSYVSLCFENAEMFNNIVFGISIYYSS